MLRHEHFTGAAGHRLTSLHIAGESPGLLLVGGYGRLSPLAKPFGQLIAAYCRSRKQDLRILEFRGQGSSEGQLSQLTIPDMRDDLLALADRFALSGRIGIGASLGAWAMLAAQQERPALLWGMLALAPALDWDRTYIAPRLADGRASRAGDGAIVVGEDNIEISERFLERADEARLDAAGDLAMRGPLHILHGSEDAIAPLARSADLAQQGEVALKVLPGFGHEVSTLPTKPLQQLFITECDLLLQAWRDRRMAGDPA